MFGKLAHTMYRRRKLVVGIWVVLLVVCLGLASQLGKVLQAPDFSVKGSEAQQAAAVLDKQLHLNDDKVSLVVLASANSTVNDASFQNTVNNVVAKIRADHSLGIQFLDNPIVSHNPQGISRDKHAVAVTFSSSLGEQDQENFVDPLRTLVKNAAPGFTTYVTGSPATNYDNNIANKDDLAHAEMTTIPILLVILILVFGAIVAAALPLLVTLFTILLGLALVSIVGHIVTVNIFVTNVVTVIGTGISIDYSLFIAYRFREELRRANGDTEAAIVRTMETTGRAIFISGFIVAVGLATLLLMGIQFMTGMGVGGIIIPVSALAVAMTLLPAVLSLLGTRINKFRVLPERFLTTGQAGQGMWHRIASAVMARPVVFGVVVLAIMLALAFPITHFNLAIGSTKNLPKSEQSVAGFLYMQNNFNSAPNPVQIVVQRQGSGTLIQPQQLAGIRGLAARLKLDPEAATVTSPTDLLPATGTPSAAQLRQVIGRSISPDMRTALITVVGKDDAGTMANRRMVERYRDTVIPSELGTLPGDQVLVGGRPANYLAFDTAVYSKFPFIIALVLLLAYIFLLFAFESVFLPLKAVLLNLLSVAAAYGLLVLVFQDGVGSKLIGFTPESGITSWVPVFLFAFLFGLSMDYEVFMLSRIRESWLVTHSNREAVASGLEKTGRLITSAAGIMVVAFGGFMLGSQVAFKEFGFGLVASIAIDATLVRVLLVPSIMELSGGLNWYLPPFLRGIVQRVGLAENEGEEPPFTPTPAFAGAGAGPTSGTPSGAPSVSSTVVLPNQAPVQSGSTGVMTSSRSPFLTLSGDGNREEYPVTERTRIGRSPGNDIIVDNPTISRRHAEILLRDGSAVVRDLKSANGTMVNGRRIAGEEPLQEGDTVTFGDTSFVYHQGS